MRLKAEGITVRGTMFRADAFPTILHARQWRCPNCPLPASPPDPLPPPCPPSSPQGVGELWGGAYDAPMPVPPRLMCLAQFAEEAADQGALVFIATKGGLGGDGDIQVLLDSYGVPYTGVGGVGGRFTHRQGGAGRGGVSQV